MNRSKDEIGREICIGWASEDITPDYPVSLWGQYYERISEYVQSPLTITAFAIESTDHNNQKEQAIMASLDLLNVDSALQESLRNIVKDQITDFDVNKLFLNATHTHSAPNPEDNEYRVLLLDKLSKAVVFAWSNRKPAGISNQLGHAVIGHNRRVKYSNGTTEMYGTTDRDDFIGLEGPEDPGVKMLFCWDLNKKLTGIIMNVACPAQVTEAKYYVSSDYWGEVRKRLREKFPDVYLLAQISAAGDISPRDLPRGYKTGEPNMWDVPGTVEIGKRLVKAIDDAFPGVKNNISTKPIFKHIVKNIEIPTRKYSKEDCKKAMAIIKKIRSKDPKDPNSPETAWSRFLEEIKENEKTKEYGPWDNKLSDYGIVMKQEALVKQYADQDQHQIFPVELHVVRCGEVCFATNPFELFMEYGIRIEGRSKAKLTFVVQLSSGDYGGYLPTQQAIEGKGYRGYGALVNAVGPEGGQVLVNETVSAINDLFTLPEPQ